MSAKSPLTGMLLTSIPSYHDFYLTQGNELMANSQALIDYAQAAAEAWYAYMPLECTFLYGTETASGSEYWQFAVAFQQPGIPYLFMGLLPIQNPAEVPSPTQMASVLLSVFLGGASGYVDPSTCPTFTWVEPDPSATLLNFEQAQVRDATAIPRPEPEQPLVNLVRTVEGTLQSLFGGE